MLSLCEHDLTDLEQSCFDRLSMTKFNYIMKNIIAALLLLVFTASCVETVVVGSVATMVVVTREKTLTATKDDIAIAAQIDAEFIKEGLKTPHNAVAIMVNEGRVLLVGEIKDVAKGRKAVEICWKVAGVKEVIDEIQINSKGLALKDLTDTIKDGYLTSYLKTKLFFKPSIIPSNYKLLTENSIVYVLGVAKNERDMKEALNVIAGTRGVKKVVNHIILVNDSRRN